MKVCAVVTSIDEQFLHGCLLNLMIQTRRPDEVRIYSDRFNVTRHWRWFTWWYAKYGVELVYRYYEVDILDNGVKSFGKLYASIFRKALEESDADVFWLLEEDIVVSANALEALLTYIDKYNAVMPRAEVAQHVQGDNSGIVFVGGGVAEYGPRWALLVKREALEKVLGEVEEWIHEEDAIFTYRLRPFVVKDACAIHLKDTYDFVYGVPATRVRGFAQLVKKVLDRGVKL